MPGRALPRLAGIGTHLRRELAELSLGEQRGVVLRVSLDGQAVALDRVGQDDRGPTVVDGPVGLVQRGQVMAAEVADGGRQGAVVEVGDEPGERLVAVRQPPAQLVRGAAEQPLVLGVGHGVDPVPQRLPARPGEQLLQQPTVLQRDDLPARRGEHAPEPVGGDQRDHAVQRLAVHVDDPDDLAEVGHAGVDDGLPHGTFVEFGVTEQRVLPAGAAGAIATRAGPARAGPGVEVPAQVAAGHRPPDRGGRADADRSRGVVDRIGVLDPARIALQSAISPQRGQVRLVELTEQVVDGVQHGRGVRLDRHPVLGAQVPEPQRGHDGDHRGGRCLMPADLQAAGVGPDPVRVVDDRRGQPEHLALDLGQRVHALGF